MQNATQTRAAQAVMGRVLVGMTESEYHAWRRGRFHTGNCTCLKTAQRIFNA